MNRGLTFRDEDTQFVRSIRYRDVRHQMFERLRDAVNAALDAAMPPTDWRDLKSQMRQAAVEGRAALAKIREDLARTEQAVSAERTLMEDARRRGDLASTIDDPETVEVAERFARKHAERLAVLEQKRDALRAELLLVEREVEEMVGQLKELEFRGGGPAPHGAPRMAMPDEEEQQLRSDLDRAGREADAAARLEELKKRMGR